MLSFKPVTTIVSPLTLKYQASLGANLVFIVIVFMVMLVFAGMVAYTGMTGTISEQVQNVVSSAAMTGAGALYQDTAGTGAPNQSVGGATAAATDVFAAHVALSSSLQAYGTTLQGVAVDPGLDTVSVRSSSIINLPFLGLIGLNGLRLNHQFTARAAKYVPTGLPVTLGTGGGGATCGGAGPTSVTLELRYPLTDRPGTDLAVGANNLHGYFILACNSTDCWDLGGAAKPLPGGAVRTATLPGLGGTGRAVYGTSFIDLAAVSPDYAARVRKATSLVIMDDGVADRFDGGQHLLELCPSSGAGITRVELYHQAVACVNGATACPLLANMLPMP
jgi:hypothetical protein